MSKFVDIGKNIIQGFIDGVNSLWDTAMRKIKDFGKSIISSGKKGTEEHSPSKAFKQIGAFVIEGFNIGIKDMMGSSFSLMNTWTKGITAYSPTVGLSVDTSALKYYDSADYARTISANVSANSNNQLFVDESATKEVMKEAVLQFYAPLKTAGYKTRNGNNHAKKVDDLVRQIEKSLRKDMNDSDRGMLLEALGKLEEVQD